MAVSAFLVVLALLVFAIFIAIARLFMAYPLKLLLASEFLRRVALLKIVFVNACQKIDALFIDAAFKAILRSCAALLGKQLLARKSWLRGRGIGGFGSSRS
jgi:hypothetical protein